MASSSSSKVTVEYHDPSGLFNILEPHLRARLPLRNLHWKSPARPLRSIDSLHVDFVPGRDPTDDFLKSLPPPSSDGRRSRAASASSLRPGSSDGRPGRRRHQIPGLSQTPYLKIFILRCDDNDTYKVSSRKLLREWIKENTPASESGTKSTQENHDAFEWLVLHVVLPDTPAAAQPRLSGSASASTGAIEKSASASRWPGRGSTTIFEKIRSDFNGTSKSAPDRISQIRLEMKDIPPHLIPPGIGQTSNPYNDSPQEILNSWSDTIIKFKTLILSSFDLRVSQYEEDIKEKDAQRHLPGWNFNTFFVLKEGLARGFESVGLVDDALVGYDELSVGLDTIVREHAADGYGGSFLENTEDVKKQFLVCRKTPGTNPFGEKPISSSRKDYRGMILSNNISIFDFRCYIFSRQMALLLRLGNASISRSEFLSSSRPSSRPNSRPSTAQQAKASTDDFFLGTRTGQEEHETEDLTSLGELCRRAMSFLNIAAHILRDDLTHAVGNEVEPVSAEVIDNFVSSWSYAVAQQILDDTASSYLPITTFDKTSGSMPGKQLGPKQDLKVSVPENKSLAHPKRSSSLLDRRASVQDLASSSSRAGQAVYEHSRFNSTGNQLGKKDQASSIGTQAKSGQPELAAHRAELYLVQRRILERLGKKLSWLLGWAAVAAQHEENKFSDVSLDDEKPEPVPEGEEERNGDTKGFKDGNIAGICESTLRGALESNDDFRNIYEQLSDLAVKHYLAASRSKSAESIMGDLAALKFESGDYSAAATYFSRMAPLYAQNRWNLVEVTMLKMYAQCLKKLNRKDEYVRVLLDLLAKSAANRKPSVSLKMRRGSVHTPWLDDDRLDTTGILDELVTFSGELPYDVTAPMNRYFSDIVVNPYIQHYPDHDGFQMMLTFRHLLEDDVEVEKAKIRLVSMDPGENRDIWLETREKLDVKQGQVIAWVHTNVVTLGYYAVDKVVLEAKKIHFTFETTKKEETLQSLGISIPGASLSSSKVPKKYRVLTYPRADAFDAKLTVARAVHIDKIKSLELDCRTFASNVTKAEVHMKAASAGLRLRTANAKVFDGDGKITDRPGPGVFGLSEMAPQTAMKISIPYELEANLSDLHIKLEIIYHTEQGEHEFRDNCTINIELPLDVNVHDQFMERMLLSTFKVTTSNHVPLDVLNIQLKGTPAFDVDPAKLYGSRNPVRPGQPPAFVYRISRKEGTSLANAADSNLSLSINYRCLDDHVYEKLEEHFSKSLQESKFAYLGRLLFPRLWENLKVTLTAEDWHRASFDDELRCGSFEDAGWPATIGSLPTSIREELQDWLEEWHRNNPAIDVTPPKDRTEAIIAPITRRITITVAVPRVQILNIAHLDLTTPVPSPAFTPPIAPLGVPLTASLRIKHTRKWDEAAALAKAANLAAPDDPVCFVYEIDADPNVWLLGGARRVQFEAREGEIKKFPLTLVPLREGYPRWLPSVSIRAVPREDKTATSSGIVSREASRDRAGGDQQLITCEMDLISQHACVQVVPDWKSVTVGVGVFSGGESGDKSASEAVLLEAGGREDYYGTADGWGEEGRGVTAGMGLPVEFAEEEKVASGDGNKAEAEAEVEAEVEAEAEAGAGG
ncbi:tmem1 family protein [Diplodia corticola]|uniref:Tmem1 family protein n=1 Tax=Diplodia corticola TaxID=236234 RepID=A0A1J9RWQ2_9PEZI|nr:tmem1 family protein [Diplodia corticola]OJD31917.1 tmem1 family protein [Diplodia corticola]